MSCAATAPRLGGPEHAPGTSGRRIPGGPRRDRRRPRVRPARPRSRQLAVTVEPPAGDPAACLGRYCGTGQPGPARRCWARAETSGAAAGCRWTDRRGPSPAAQDRPGTGRSARRLPRHEYRAAGSAGQGQRPGCSPAVVGTGDRPGAPPRGPAALRAATAQRPGRTVVEHRRLACTDPRPTKTRLPNMFEARRRRSAPAPGSVLVGPRVWEHPSMVHPAGEVSPAGATASWRTSTQRSSCRSSSRCPGDQQVPGAQGGRHGHGSPPARSSRKWPAGHGGTAGRRRRPGPGRRGAGGDQAARRPGSRAPDDGADDLPELRNGGQFPLTNRLRTSGTDYLLEAAAVVGTRQFVACETTGTTPGRAARSRPSRTRSTRARCRGRPGPGGDQARRGGPWRRSKGIHRLPARARGSLVLRYGILYERRLRSTSRGGAQRRQLPVIGEGTGIWSFTEVTDAAARPSPRSRPWAWSTWSTTKLPVAQWVPYWPRCLGVKPPVSAPAWLENTAARQRDDRRVDEEGARGQQREAKRELGYGSSTRAARRLPGLGRGLQAEGEPHDGRRRARPRTTSST